MGSLLHWSESNTQVNVVLEFGGKFSLADYLFRQSNMCCSEDNAKSIMRQLFTALGHLHVRGLCHRDVKLENILLKEIDPPFVKLIDFGFVLDQSPTELTSPSSCGTPYYMSPEIIQKKAYKGGPADVWATGVLMYKLLMGFFPFRGFTEKEVCAAVLSGRYERPKDLSDEAVQFIELLLSQDPSRRPTAQVALSLSLIHI
eukprot:TRINITY_DN9176_c0_g1_i6.p1 TRINITY_DN9176_c0_g1~~TRINITY_DN9176_c0_g1_i6.p1  ORF type:complete len:201 (+),score=17.77 TRINITY_DN9176_c0_g1_i6:95-697(+)